MSRFNSNQYEDGTYKSIQIDTQDSTHKKINAR
jgi:uncharacterized protein YaiE (UPF0345 family)